MPPTKSEKKQTNSLRLGLINIQCGIGTTRGYYQYLLHLHKYSFPHSSKNIEKLGEICWREKIDILASTEIDQGSTRTKNIDQAGLLARTGGFKYSAFFPSLAVRDKINQGNAIHSRYPIIKSCNYRLPGAGEPRSAGSAEIDINGKLITFFITHLSLRFPFRQAQIKALSEHINQAKPPVVLAGDFNIQHEGELDLLDQSRLQKLFAAKTYPSWKPARQLDYFFASREIWIKKGEVLPDRISDHCFLSVEIKY